MEIRGGRREVINTQQIQIYHHIEMLGSFFVQVFLPRYHCTARQLHGRSSCSALFRPSPLSWLFTVGK